MNFFHLKNEQKHSFSDSAFGHIWSSLPPHPPCMQWGNEQLLHVQPRTCLYLTTWSHPCLKSKSSPGVRTMNTAWWLKHRVVQETERFPSPSFSAPCCGALQPTGISLSVCLHLFNECSNRSRLLDVFGRVEEVKLCVGSVYCIRNARKPF